MKIRVISATANIPRGVLLDVEEGAIAPGSAIETTFNGSAYRFPIEFLRRDSEEPLIYTIANSNIVAQVEVLPDA